MKKQPVSKTLESTLLLNIKDIEAAKSSNMDNKMKNQAKTIDASLEKYNTNVKKALEAPVPDIKLHFSEVLLRAVPLEIKTKSGLILGINDVKTADRIERLSEAIDQKQEILMVGSMVSKEDQAEGIRPGRLCKFRLDRFRTISDRHQPGMAQVEYNIPSEEIDGYKYLIIDKRDIIYTKDMD